MQSISDFLIRLFAPLADLGRPIKLAEPFIGIGGASEMLRLAGIPVTSFNVFEMEEKLEEYHSKKSATTEHHLVNTRFGKHDGNFFNVKLESLVDVDGWISASPLPAMGWQRVSSGQVGPESAVFRKECGSNRVLGQR